MGNIINIVKRFSNNNAVVLPFQRRCFDVPIGISRLNKCIDNDSSLMGKIDPVTTGSTDGCDSFHKELGNYGMHLTPTSIISGRGYSHSINFDTLSTAHIEQSVSDEAKKDRETHNETINTGSRELGCDEYFEKAGLIYSKTSDHMIHSLKDENPKTRTGLMISNDFINEVSSEANYSKNPELTDELEENRPTIDTHEIRGLRMHRVSRVSSLSGHNVCEELVDGLPSSEVASEGHRDVRTQHKLLSDGIVPKEAITACTTSDFRGIKSTAKPSLKRHLTRKRTTVKTSNQMLEQKEKIRISVRKASLTKQARSTTKASHQILVRKENIKISVPSDVLCVATVHQSPLTRSKAKSLSISTPESMKRSRSGRLIVPQLDPGTQNIIYGPDGIIGITNLEFHHSQGSDSEPASKRKRSRRLSADQNRMLTF